MHPTGACKSHPRPRRQPLKGLVLVLGHCHRPEAGKMFCNELGVQQLESTGPQPCHQINQRHFAGIRHATEHALAKKCRADMHAIKSRRPVRYLASILPSGHAPALKCRVKLDDPVIDPCFRPCLALALGTIRDHLFKGAIDPDLEMAACFTVFISDVGYGNGQVAITPRSGGINPVEDTRIGAFCHGEHPGSDTP